MSMLLLLSCPVMSDSLRPHGLQPARPFCPSPLPEVCPSSRPLHWGCHPAISSSDTLFSFCPQSFQASETFPVSQLFTSDDQNIGVSASASVPSNEYSGLISLKIDWFDLLAVQGTLRSLLLHHSTNASILWCSIFLYGPALTIVHDLCEDYSFDNIWTFIGRVMPLLFNTLSGFVIAFLSRSKFLLSSWLQSPSARWGNLPLLPPLLPLFAMK